jgi:hypothetical protein
MSGITTQQQIYIQKLNNNAAMCIETGTYGRAMSGLVKAMNLIDNENTQQQASAVPCGCSQCNLDSCLTISRRASDTRKNLYLAAQATIQTLSGNDYDYQEEEEQNENGRYVFQEPIRFPPIRSGHALDPTTIHLVVAFNLALASHLRAMDKNNKTVKECLTASLNLYELVASMMISSSMVESSSHKFAMVRTRFAMALCNNLSEIHRMNGNQKLYMICLEELLSATMMLVVDNQQDAMDLEGFLKTHIHIGTR